MKKIEILLYHREQESFLTAVRQSGAVHAAERYDSLSPQAQIIREEIVRIDQTIRTLSVRKVSAQSSDQIADICTRTELAVNERDRLIQSRTDLIKLRDQLQPWGSFEPSQIEQLRRAGVSVRFYRCSLKELALFADRCAEVISRDGSKCRVVVFDRSDPVKGVEPITLPAYSLQSVLGYLAETETRLCQIESELDLLAGQIELLHICRENLESDFQAECARISMEPAAKERILHLTAWIPESAEQKMRDLLNRFACWYEISRPVISDDVPVELQNRGLFRVFEPLTKVFALPNYFELDPTPFFAPFYALFFGLCLGDVGYGILLFLLGIIMAKKLKESSRPLGYLAAVLGVSTFVSGFFLNSFFGVPIFKMTGAENGMLSIGSELALFQPIPGEGTQIFPMMAFAVYLGIFQMMTAMFLKGINRWSLLGWQYAVHPAASILMTAACTAGLAKADFINMGTLSLGVIPLGEMLSSAAPNTLWMLFGTGAVLLFLFNNPSQPIYLRIPLGLWEMYGFITGLIGDSLSYIRLFALGLSGGLLAAAFNQIAVIPITSEGAVHWDSPLVIFTVLIMVFGHLINFALSLVGSFVHPMRLTFVEFYKNLDFQGGAKPYRPLKPVSTNK